MSALSSSTVAMMANNILKNYKEGNDLQHDFIKSATFFEQSVLREQLYQLYSIKLSVKAELD